MHFSCTSPIVSLESTHERIDSPPSCNNHDNHYIFSSIQTMSLSKSLLPSPLTRPQFHPTTAKFLKTKPSRWLMPHIHLPALIAFCSHFNHSFIPSHCLMAISSIVLVHHRRPAYPNRYDHIIGLYPHSSSFIRIGRHSRTPQHLYTDKTTHKCSHMLTHTYTFTHAHTLAHYHTLFTPLPAHPGNTTSFRS
jgi:hypothetical protein